jgi:hypothetical protein
MTQAVRTSVWFDVSALPTERAQRDPKGSWRSQL